MKTGLNTHGLDVRDFGTTPDSGEDAAPAFQAAIDAAATRRSVVIEGKIISVASTVVVPPGEFVFQSSVHLHSGVSLTGASLGCTTIRYAGIGPCLDLTTSEEMFDVSVANISFVGNEQSGCGYDAVHANRGVVIDNCLFSGFEDAIRFYDCYTPSIQNCVIWNNRRHGIHILDGHNVTLFNNRIENSAMHGIHCTHTPTNAATAITLYGNVCQGNGAAGYSFEGVNQFYMGGNFAEGNNRNGDGWACVHISSSEGIKQTSHSINGLFITAGRTTARGSVGIHVDSVRHVSFRDVYIRSNEMIDRGIELAASVGVAVVDNCYFEDVPDGIVVASDRTTVHYTPRLAQARRYGRVFQGPGQVSDGLEFRRLDNLQVHAGRQGAGFVGVGTVDGRPSVQAHAAGAAEALRLNPNGGNVAVGHHEPEARLDVEGGACFRGGDVVVDGDWRRGRLRLGALFLWTDSAGNLRVKRGEPQAEDDGRVVSVEDDGARRRWPRARPLRWLRAEMRKRKNGADTSRDR